MKAQRKFFLIIALFIFGTIETSHAQFSFSVRIGNPPVWAPREYAERTRYYYFPEMDCYYDAEQQGYYYNEEGNWIFSAYLPSIYAGYNFYTGPKIYLNYFGGRPFDYFRERRDGFFREYHPEGQLDYYGGFERRRGHASGWDDRYRNQGQYQNNYDGRQERENEDRSQERYGNHSGRWGSDQRGGGGAWGGERRGETGNYRVGQQRGDAWGNRGGDHGGDAGNYRAGEQSRNAWGIRGGDHGKR